MINKSNLKDDPIIELDNVTLQIPLMSKSDFSLKRKIIKSVTGGAVSYTHLTLPTNDRV